MMRQNNISDGLKLKQQVYHKDLYCGKEPFIIVGIRENEVELQGDYSGGTHNVCQTSWMPIDGLITEFVNSKESIKIIQYKKPSYSNIIEFIERNNHKPEDVFIKAWDDPNENKNISAISGTSHLAIRTPNGIVKLNNGDWVVYDKSGAYFVFDKDDIILC